MEELAVGLNVFETTVDEMLKHLEAGNAAFKAIRGDYGCGKTFFLAEVQISRDGNAVARLETIYSRLVEGLNLAGKRT